MVAVRTDVPVSMGPTETTPVWQTAQRLHTGPRWQWCTMRCRRGTTGWLCKKAVAVHRWRVASGGQRHVGWLLGERATRGRPEERKYYWSNLPADTTLATLVRYAHRRHAVEPLHEEAKGELGWDQYQGGLWPGGIGMP